VSVTRTVAIVTAKSVLPLLANGVISSAVVNSTVGASAIKTQR